MGATSLAKVTSDGLLATCAAGPLRPARAARAITVTANLRRTSLRTWGCLITDSLLTRSAAPHFTLSDLAACLSKVSAGGLDADLHVAVRPAALVGLRRGVVHLVPYHQHAQHVLPGRA